MQYFRTISIPIGYRLPKFTAVHCSNRSKERMCAAIVRGAPEIKTRCRSFANSPDDSSSDWSSSVSSLASAPARLPIASSRPAQRTFSAFSWSSNGVFDSVGWSRLGFLHGAMGRETRAFIAACFLSFETGEFSIAITLDSHSPNPNWTAVDWKKTFSAATANDQNCSSFEESLTNTSATFWSKTSQSS